MKIDIILAQLEDLKKDKENLILECEKLKLENRLLLNKFKKVKLIVQSQVTLLKEVR